MQPQQNDLLCRVENDAPMGRLMRQHWMPACMIEEVEEAGGTPRRIRLLGTNMVVFRDSKGRVGALDELCPHRRASLVFGRNEEECGLRCLYHGWKFDVEGNVIDMSSEPEGSHMNSKIKARAYPVIESAGFVWIWMGDPENVAEFDPPQWSSAPDHKIAIVKMHGACNWAQILEGSIDSSHSSSLHSSNMPTADVDGSTARDGAWLRPSADKSPRIEVEKTSFGFRYAAIRKPIKDADKQDYVRTTLFIAPYTVIIPSNDQYHLSQMLVPIDDVNTAFYWVAWHPDEDKGISTDEWRKFCGAEIGKDVEPVTFKKARTYENNYLQDRAAMKAGDFTGIYGIPAQDMAMWESMGPIADRSEDNLGTSDKAIFTFRTMMYRAAQAVDKGEPAIGVGENRLPHASLMSFQGMVPKGNDWKEYNISEEEKAQRADAGGAKNEAHEPAE